MRIIQTVEIYLRTNYDIVPVPGLRELLAAHGVHMDRLADARAEFACDCLWDAMRDTGGFLESAIRQNRICDREYYRLLAARFAGRVVNRVRHVWVDHGRTHGERMESSVQELVTDYLTQYAVPCGNPWDAVMACQVSEDLAFLAGRARTYAEHHGAEDCRQECERTTFPETDEIFAHARANGRLGRDGVKHAYRTLLQKAYGCLASETKGDRNHADHD